MVVLYDSTVGFRYSAEAARHMGGPYDIPAGCIENGGRPA